jgi:hypothetical protein
MPLSDLAPDRFKQTGHGGISFKDSGKSWFYGNADLKIGSEPFQKSNRRRREDAVTKRSQANEADPRILGQLL